MLSKLHMEVLRTRGGHRAYIYARRKYTLNLVPYKFQLKRVIHIFYVDPNERITGTKHIDGSYLEPSACFLYVRGFYLEPKKWGHAMSAVPVTVPLMSQ